MDFIGSQMQKSLLQALLNIGFRENEAIVYIALLELGQGTVAQIAQRAGINRTTGYSLLNVLVKRGLVMVSGKKPRQTYVAESPDKLTEYLEGRTEEMKEHLQTAQTLVPQLRTVHNVEGRPKVRFYEGTRGLKEVYEDTLTSHETIRAYATVDDMHRALPDYFPKYYERRAKAGVAIRAIIPATKIGQERADRDKQEARESVLIPAEAYYFSPEINIYDDKIMIASWREKLGIIIESAEIAEAMKKIFELSWPEAKRLQGQMEKKDTKRQKSRGFE